MNYIYLLASVFLIASGGISGAFYNRKNEGRKGATALYNLLVSLGSFLVLAVVACFSFRFHAPTLLFSLGFGACYVITNISMLFALQNGPVSLTSLVMQLSLIGVAFWGFVFWNEAITPFVVIGCILAVAALVLCLKRKKGEEKTKISGKWILFSGLMFSGNAACTILQKTQIRMYGEAYGNMMMFFALIFAAIFCLIRFLTGEREDAKTILKKSGWIPLLAGILNGVLNLFIILLASRLSASVVYPVISVGGLVVSVTASMLLFKEKLNALQWTGVGLGLIAVLLLAM